MSVQTVDIAEGIRLNIIETDKFKTDYLSLNFIVPLANETASFHALLPRVLTRGCRTYPDMHSIHARLDALYDTMIGKNVGKKGDNQIISFYASMLSNSYVLDGVDVLGGTMELLRDIIFNPYLENDIFSEKYVISEKKNLIDAIKSKINDKASYALMRCREEMCRGDRHGISAIGSEEGVSAITAASLTEKYYALVHQAPMEIFFVGNPCGRDIEELVRKSFQGFLEERTKIMPTEILTSSLPVRTIQEKQQVKQGKLVLGFRDGFTYTEEKFSALQLFTEIYGGSASSKLFVNVREKMSLCYYCSAGLEAHKGLLFVSCGVDAENREKAEAEILRQLAEMQNGNITEKEIHEAKMALISALRERNDRADLLEMWYLNKRLVSKNESPEDVIEKIQAVTKEEIQEAALRMKLDTVYFLFGDCAAEEEWDEEDE